MDIRSLILKTLAKKKAVKVAEIVGATGFSRAYIGRFFQELREEGKIILLGRANKACYILAKKEAVKKAKSKVLSLRRILKNSNLSEDAVLSEIKRDTGIFLGLGKNISAVVDYGFTEMLNNAIEHSGSKKIEISLKKDNRTLRFDVIDQGAGVFRHIARKKRLKNELEAIRDLLKGKQTTAPKEHSGEGIFFTSKVADILILRSSTKKLTFNNFLNDIFIEDIKFVRGTKAIFVIGLKSKRSLGKVFRQYGEGSYEFSKTKVVVKLYKMDTDYISRSQARRILSGLEKFKTIVLDFSGVNTVGQSFADEVFRVWQGHHPAIKIIFKNENKNIAFMINRAVSMP